MASQRRIHTLNNCDRETLPMEIVNETGLDGLYFYLVGTTDPAHPEHNWCYLGDFEGNLGLCTPTEHETTYAMRISGERQRLRLPRLSGMRAYFSFGAPLLVTVPDNGIPAAPTGWAPSSNFETLFDWVELTWELDANGSTLGGNTTQVDMLGLPFELTLTGLDDDGARTTRQSGFSAGGARDRILGLLREAPSPWRELVLGDPDSDTDLRAIAPYHGMERLTFPLDQLEDYIDRVWQRYATEKLYASVEGIVYEGHVKKGELVFKHAHDHRPRIRFPRPDTRTVYLTGPLPSVDSREAGVIRAALQAGFMRSTLLQSAKLPCCDAPRYYRDAPVNVYARTLHEHAGGGAYAFGFDDVCSESSFISVHDPEAVRITLLPL